MSDTRRLIYDGVLSADTTHWILNSNYRFWLEVTDNFPWVEFSRWVESSWPKDRAIVSDDCMGQDYVRMDNNGYATDRRFLGFLTEADMKLVVEKWPSYIKKQNPFQTVFG